MIGKYLFAVLLVVLPCLAPAQQQHLSNIDDFIAKQVVDYKMPGLAIGVIRDHQVIFKKGYGTTSLSNGLAVNTQTVFPISSCTKSFTAVALGILVEENKLNWDDKVIQYLPEFKLSDPWITKELTIIDLLSHRSAFPHIRNKPIPPMDMSNIAPAKEAFSGCLYASGQDTLTIVFNDPFVPPGKVIFERGTDKKIKHFKLDIDSQDFLFGDLDFKK
ncbi:serine hydrolase domain-containing protein [Parapedobacter defluvii]|uniref:serine hydrolase domain-containing protein n=1 Tax=Parapedobacter defluvii TaxID=2045106 RepID=UPI00333F36CD